MPGTVSVDTTNETATVQFVDDHNDATAPPAGATVSFASSDPNVATVAPSQTDSFTGQISPVSTGTTKISVALTNAMEADGITPIPAPDPVTLTVDPGAAAGARLSLGPQ